MLLLSGENGNKKPEDAQLILRRVNAGTRLGIPDAIASSLLLV